MIKSMPFLLYKNTVYFIKSCKDFPAKRHVNNDLKMVIFRIILKGRLLAKEVKSGVYRVNEWIYSHPVFCIASACCKHAWTTVVSPPRCSSGRTRASSSSHTLLRASRAYKRMLKLWLKHHCRLTSTALRHCTSWERHQQYS